MDVAKGWCKEFYRLRDKVFYNLEEVNKSNYLDDCDPEVLAETIFNFRRSDYVFLNSNVKILFIKNSLKRIKIRFF